MRSHQGELAGVTDRLGRDPRLRGRPAGPAEAAWVGHRRGELEDPRLVQRCQRIVKVVHIRRSRGDRAVRRHPPTRGGPPAAHAAAGSVHRPERPVGRCHRRASPACRGSASHVAPACRRTGRPTRPARAGPVGGETSRWSGSAESCSLSTTGPSAAPNSPESASRRTMVPRRRTERSRAPRTPTSSESMGPGGTSSEAPLCLPPAPCAGRPSTGRRCLRSATVARTGPCRPRARSDALARARLSRGREACRRRSSPSPPLRVHAPWGFAPRAFLPGARLVSRPVASAARAVATAKSSHGPGGSRAACAAMAIAAWDSRARRRGREPVLGRCSPACSLEEGISEFGVEPPSYFDLRQDPTGA